MKTENTKRHGQGILAIICLAALAGQAYALTDDEYVNVYFSMASAYYKGEQVKNEFFDMIVYYLQNEDVNANLDSVGSLSGKRIETIIDENGAPCEVIDGAACSQDNMCLTEGSTCCCSKRLYSCKQMTPALYPLQEIIPSAAALVVMTSWSYASDCAQGCCGRSCCGGNPTTTSSTTSTTIVIPKGDPCTSDAECANYGIKWSCLPAGGPNSFCTYAGTFTTCSDGTVIGQCSVVNPGKICMEEPLGTYTILASTTKCT